MAAQSARAAAWRYHSRGAAVLAQLDPAGRRVRLLLAAVVAVGLAVRLWGISRPPLEFHPARQFMGAAIARHYYLQNRPDVPEWRRVVAERNKRNENMLEPHVLEHTAAWGYRLAGGEYLWIPRGFSVCFWLLGGLFLYRIAVRFTVPGGALVAVAFHLGMPFGILASRSFQPDPLMLCLQLAGILGLVRFAEQETMPRLLAAAALCAAAVFVKPVCLFVLLGVYGLGSIGRKGVLATMRSRYTWAFAAVLLMPVSHYLWKIVLDMGGSDLGSQADGSIVPRLLLTRTFWRGLMVMLGRVTGFVPLLLALAGLLLANEKPEQRGTLAGMWLGYAGFAATFTFHTHTHDYYHLPLLPIAGLSLGVLSVIVLGMVLSPPNAWRRRLLAGIAAVVAGGIALGIATETGGLLRGGRSGRAKSLAKAIGATLGVPQKFAAYLHPESIRMSAQIAAAQEVGKAVNNSPYTVFLGPDGGTALTYLGEFSGVRWPAQGNIQKDGLLGEQHAPAETRLRQMLEREPKLRYFVVTDFGDLEQQDDLKRLLSVLPTISRRREYSIHLLQP